MATYRTAVNLHNVNNLPEDDVVWGFYFHTVEADPEPSTAEALAGAVSAALYDTNNGGGVSLFNLISAEISRVNTPTIKVYDAVAGGSPLHVVDMLAIQAAVAATSLPSEVAICLSYASDLTDIPEEAPDGSDPGSAPDRPASRRRGRTFIGPWTTQGAAGAPARPSTNARELTAYLGIALGEVGDTSGLSPVGTQWVVWSKQSGGAWSAVEKVWVDDAFDTQRRRGMKPTMRTEFAV